MEFKGLLNSDVDKLPEKPSQTSANMWSFYFFIKWEYDTNICSIGCAED